jgi:hypothetical protein
LGLFLKMRSEDYLIERMINQIGAINHLTGNIYSQHAEKWTIKSKILTGIQKQGYKFSGQLTEHKKILISTIEAQQKEVVIINNYLKSINRLMSLLVYMEQSDLFIHKRKDDSDLADLVDPSRTPLKKFTKEIDQINILIDSFDILKVELEKQKQYIKSFTLDPSSLEEDYFQQSEKYISELSRNEITNISQLKHFAEDLQINIRKHFRPGIQSPTESDKAALYIIHEMKRIRMGGNFWSPSMYDYIVRLVRHNLYSKKLDTLIAFFICFLLSRMKRYKEKEYYSQLRVALLAYNLPIGFDNNKREILVAGMLLAKLHDLTSLQQGNDEMQNEEMELIKKYYSTVKEILNDEFTLIHTLLDMYHKVSHDKLHIDWLNRCVNLMGIVSDFDNDLAIAGFDASKVEETKVRLHKKHPDEKETVDFLFARWKDILPVAILR